MAVFLMENGVLSMGNKTPVTILQETLQRKGQNPHYELIYDGTGSVDPIFKYQVSAEGFTAIGDGKSKKEAKHDAAATILKRMQAGTESSNAQEIDIASPYTGSIKQNFVGMLDEICVTNKIPFPVFVLINEDGPPHAKIFTMQCRLSTCSETAVARTKKQAKHLAAQQMINQIAKIMRDKFIPISEKTGELEDPSLKDSNLKAIENGSYRHNLSIPIADFHNVFYLNMEVYLIPKSFLDLSSEPETFYDNLENPKQYLSDIVLGLEGVCTTVSVSKEALKESFKEIEKDCQMFDPIQEEELDYYIKDQINSNDVNDNNCTDYVRQLEEFVLEEDDEDISLESPKCEEILANRIDGSWKNGIHSEDKLEVDSPMASPIFLFISVECPQGKWTFRGFGGTFLQAERRAAIEALRFFRLMSIPTNSTKSQSEP